MKMQPEYTRGHVGILPFWAVTVPYVTSEGLAAGPDSEYVVTLAGMGGWAWTKHGARRLARKFQAEIEGMKR